jgi:hypothetical protein
MPQSALVILAAESGPILDVGGGAAPFARAKHILDIIPFDAERVQSNAWGGEPAPWTKSDYTEFDLCAGSRWPFPDQSFALGLCSHTLEDMRDPLPALAEMGRVCRRLLIITPSRLLEQTRGIDHPRFCGFAHHPWIVFADAGGLVFRRKTAYLNFSGCHLHCPLGRTLPVDAGTFVYSGGPVAGRELALWSGEDEVEDYRKFIRPYQSQTGTLFVPDEQPVTLKRRIYRFRQQFLGVP